MVSTWFTSDTHFGHKNILEYEKDARPFSSVEEMNEQLIINWNNAVRPQDIIYHLGDFAFGKHNIDIAVRLNGRKRLILGNHDTYDNSLYLCHFERTFGCVFWKRCLLTHIPVHPSNLGARAFLNVHGHLHSNIIMSNEIIAPEKQYPMNWCIVPDKNYFNVSVEQHNLTPVHSDVIMERLKELE